MKFIWHSTYSKLWILTKYKPLADIIYIKTPHNVQVHIIQQKPTCYWQIRNNGCITCEQCEITPNTRSLQWLEMEKLNSER